MNSDIVTVDDLSQPISESYLHLSRDNITELSNSSSIDLSDFEVHDTNMLLRLAKHIDDQNQFSNRSKSNSPITDQSPDYNQNTVHEDSLTKKSETDFMAGSNKKYPNSTTEHEKTKVGTFLKFASPPFSSHSTPLVSKKAGYGHSTMKWSKYSRDNFLSDISETKNDATTMNDAKSSPPARAAVPPAQSPVDERGCDQPRFTLDELLNDIVPLFNEQIRAKMKDSVLRLIHQTQEQQSKVNNQEEPNPLKENVFITPIRINSNSNSGNLDYSEEDEDQLSLDGMPFDSKSNNPKNTVNPDGSIINRAQSVVVEDIESPTTTPPHSREFNDSKLASIIIQPDYESVDGKDIDDIKPSNQIDAQQSSIRLEQLEKEVELLQKENLDLKIDLNKLQLDLITKNNDIRQEEDTNLIDITENSDIYEPQASPKNKRQNDQDKADNQLKQKNQALEMELARTKLKNDELINEFNWYKASQEKVDSHVNQGPDQPKKIDALSLEGKFRDYYRTLHLDEVDKLSKLDMSNLIKNLMLSLLISDYENLPSNARKYGKFIGVSLKFMDSVHKQLYREPTGDINKDITPSYYLKNDRGFVDQDLENLQGCLSGMIQTIKEIIK